MQHITLPDHLLPCLAPYSHAVKAGDFLFITGQLAEDPATGNVMRGPIEEQTRRVMENLKLILDYCNTGFDRIVMARIFVTDLRFYSTVNEIYRSYFEDSRLPCRTTVGVTGLAGTGDVEIDLIVYCGKST